MCAELAGGRPPGPVPREGLVSPRVAEEFPGLGIFSLQVPARPGRSPEPLKARLRGLSDRFYGSHAIHLRERPIPWAYRVFYRQIGLDPDQRRTPVEQLALERLERGAFESRGLPEDAVRVAIAETGVAVLALDAAGLTGALSIRDSAPGEALAGEAELEAGTLVIADEVAPVGVLFGQLASGRAVGGDTERVVLVAIQVGGVPQIAVDEALQLAAGALADPDLA